MSTIMLCDTCGEELGEYYVSITKHGMYTAYGIWTDIDLCPKCWKSIEDCLKSKFDKLTKM